jgi:hypothetical protein
VLDQVVHSNLEDLQELLEAKGRLKEGQVDTSISGLYSLDYKEERGSTYISPLDELIPQLSFIDPKLLYVLVPRLPTNTNHLPSLFRQRALDRPRHPSDQPQFLRVGHASRGERD